LHQEALLNRQYSDKFEELQNLRERTLHEVADALHDQVIPELRGLQFASTALSRALQDGHNDSLAGDARYIADSLDTLSARARAIVDGAKPVDWDETDLCQALHWLASSFDRSNQGLEVRLECQVGQEDPAAAKDAIYWTAWAALSNVQNHAHASRVDLQVRSSAQAMQLVITDNGRGFDLSQVGQQAHRRQLGVSNMVQRAAQVGGSLDIETAPGRGTRITMTIPRVQPPAGSLAAASTTGLSPERIG
jgi:signal transduction histidine kinase